ncbi:MAG: DUF4097 family beta strand repeat-containing protein [Chloroflexota bacterium]|nr:DUF4097 family beta strand repeat-containing protein [Chloroflexota bacterium]
MGTYVRTQSIDHTVGERGSVSVSVTSGDVQARAVAGGDVHLRATFQIRASSDAEADRIFDATQLLVQRGDGQLTVEEHDGAPSLGAVIGRIFSGNGHIELTIEAEIPTAAHVRLTAVSSDMEVSGLRGDQRYRTVSGDLQLSDMGGSIRLETVSGDTTIRADEPIALQVQGVSGDVNVIAPLLRSLSASTVSGDVELEGELAGDGDFRVETVSGDLVVGLLGDATFEVHGLSTDVHSELDHRLEGQVDRRRLIIGSGAPHLVFNSMSGDVDVRRPRRITAVARPAAPAPAATAATSDAQLEVLRALERGEIDVDEATRRLAGGA